MEPCLSFRLLVFEGLDCVVYCRILVIPDLGHGMLDCPLVTVTTKYNPLHM